jgi:MerR family mercuric resistance operon transcriptional regulator
MRGITSSRSENLPIGELSCRSGVNIETIRYYERVKMLAPPPRTASGRRIFDLRDLRILVFIRRSRELGFSLDEIRALLRLGGPDKAPCRDVRTIAAHHLEDIREKLHDLRKLERLLARTVAQCAGRTAPDCPVLDILDVQRPKSGMCGDRAAPLGDRSVHSPTLPNGLRAGTIRCRVPARTP